MYYIVLGVQCVIITLLFVECWVVFKNWKGVLHSYLFLACVSMLVNSTGYLFELLARTEEAYFTALRLSYLGRAWISFSLLLFILELTRIRVPRIVKSLLAVYNVITYFIIITTKITGLYYKKTSFYIRGRFPVFLHENGIWHDINDGMLVICIFLGLTVLAISWCREKNPMAKGSIFAVAGAILVVGGTTVIQIFKPIPLAKVYDTTMVGFYFGSVLMFIAIFKYKLLDAETLAREYVIDELSEGIIAVNEKGDVNFSNVPALSLFPDLIKEPREVVNTIRNAVDAGEPLRLKDRIYTPESNILYRNGVAIGTIYALADDTEHYRYMEELEEQKKLADDANKAKSAFLANMSHEIRTPINAVLGMDEMILRESTEKEILSYAGDIRTAGNTLLSLINDILDFSKIEEGRMEILPTQYELSSLISDIVNMIRERADKKGLRLEINVDSDIPHLLHGDAIRIKQVALNLLTNAVKYTDEGEVRLKVSFSKQEDEAILLGFMISDTGIGMKEEDMDRLFSPFSRIEEKRNRSIEGTGLGMSIVRQLLTLMDSELTVKSVYGEGSEFFFEIRQGVVKWEPIGDYSARFAEEASERVEYRELFHAPDADILVVDDTEVNLSVIRNLLKRTQIRIDTALSGQEALEKAAGKDYDIIFIDHMMPEMDGIETLHRLKESGSPDSTVYIVLTANAVSGARQRYLAEGFEDYVSKPVDGVRLEKLLKRYLPADKVRAAEPDGEPEAAEEQEAGHAGYKLLPEWLADTPELDLRQGIICCGSEEGYLSVLGVFHQTAKSKAGEIDRLFEEGDIENYTVKVHALKSSARIIGAASLSEMAKELEAAGKAGDRETIQRDTGELLRKYRELDDRLALLDGDKKELKELPEGMRKEAYQTIGEIAGSMDYGMMEQMLHDLKGYRLSEKDSEALRRMEEMLMQLDWDGISEIAASVSG